MAWSRRGLKLELGHGVVCACSKGACVHAVWLCTRGHKPALGRGSMTVVRAGARDSVAAPGGAVQQQGCGRADKAASTRTGSS